MQALSRTFMGRVQLYIANARTNMSYVVGWPFEVVYRRPAEENALHVAVAGSH